MSDVAENFHVTAAHKPHIKDLPAYVEAAAHTGLRYAALVCWLPDPASYREGGDILVTVLSPWQDAWPITAAESPLDVKYVEEHLSGNRLAGEDDYVALGMTIDTAVRYLKEARK